MGHKSKKSLINNSDNSIMILVLGVSAVTLSFKTNFYDPFNSIKFLLLLILSSWLAGHILSSYREFKPRLHTSEFKIIAIVLSFLGCMAVATLFTDIHVVGLIGEIQRKNGLLAYVGLVIVLLYASRMINFGNILIVYKVVIFNCLALSIYGIFQILGKDFVKWDNPYNRMISTLGNPNFASALLAVLSAISFFSIFLSSLHLFFKVIAVGAFSSGLVAIWGSNSRQGLLSLFFAVIFYISIALLLKNKKIGFMFIGSALLMSSLIILGMLQKGPLSALLYKDSVSVRGYYWRAGIEMFKDSPLFGVGVDRYGVFFKQFRELAYPLKYGFEITSSNAHNLFIQFFATSGFFVGIAYLILQVLIFHSGIKLIKMSDREQQKIVLGLLAAWLGFQSQSLISIDNIGISIWGWLLGGCILGLSNSVIRFTDNPPTQKSLKSGTKMFKLNLFQPIMSTLILVPTLIFVSSYVKIEQNLNYLKGISNPAYPENAPFVLDYFGRINSSPFADPQYKFISAFYLLNMGYEQKAYETLKSLQKSDPINPGFLQGLAVVEESQNRKNDAILSREKLALVDPWNAENYASLIGLYISVGNLEKAYAIRDMIFEFAPNSSALVKVNETLNQIEK